MSGRPRWMTVEDRFWEKVDKRGPNDCWLWVGSKRSGYGYFRVGKNRVGCHRWIWEYYNGPIAIGMDICHKCNVRNCVNPNHLFVGTRKENMEDMVRKNRDSHGEDRYNCKLSQIEVDWARFVLKNHPEIPQRRIAEILDISYQHMSDIIIGKRWRKSFNGAQANLGTASVLPSPFRGFIKSPAET